MEGLASEMYRGTRADARPMAHGGGMGCEVHAVPSHGGAHLRDVQGPQGRRQADAAWGWHEV